MWRVTALLAQDVNISSEYFAETMRSGVGEAITDALRDVPGVCRAVLGLRPDDPDPAVVNAFPIRHDALLEIWCESDQAAVQAARGLAKSEGVTSAVQGVLDGARGIAWLAEVVPQKPDDEGLTKVKFLAAGDVAEGWTVANAQRYWKEEHPRIARTVPSCWNGMTLYTQFHGREAPTIDLGSHIGCTRFVPMCADMGFVQPRDFIAHYSNPEYLRVVRPDEEKFARPGEMLAFVTDYEIELFSTPV